MARLAALKCDLAELLRDESATSTVEYALLLALVAVAVIAAYHRFGASTAELADESTRQIPGSGGGEDATR